MYHKYMLQNYQMSPTYRSYNDIVPVYLHGRPRSVILHCLERKSNSRKFNEEDILTQDEQNGLFTIKSSSEKVYTVNFGADAREPSCSCADWTNWHLPCKHFFAIFGLVPNWSWDALPNSYKTSSYLSTDHTPPPNPQQYHLILEDSESNCGTIQHQESEEELYRTPAATDIPTKEAS